ncbi:MaoC-like dehydratase [Caballeronia ptereochthonis]|uniref:MaoC-like dehydratase n=1 Tax=Caballeronia ptereochthonis TaxID=1777144 RepID=A0A158AZD1_9BURK|nr:MaoC-like dehydratase [Caballeronia ptereochthonis]
MAGLHFEEFKPGMVIEHAIRRTVTETDNILFSAMTYNCAPLHIDDEYSRNTMYGQRLLNSMFLLALDATSRRQGSISHLQET